MAAVQTTTLNRSWLLKMGVFLVALAGFGAWAMIDGLFVYPRRGELDASYKLYQYLQAARDAGRLTRRDVLVEQPREAISDLGKREIDLQKAAQGTGLLTGVSRQVATMDLSRLEWLRSLQRIRRLDSAPSRIQTDVGAQLTSLANEWKVNQPPKPLSAMDLTFQYVFMAGGFGAALWILAIILRAKAKRFSWEPESQRLTLPDGASIVPADIGEFDKRRWHKYYVTLILRDGSTRTLDLLRHVPLEEWILTMERTVNPEAGAEGGGNGPDGPAEPSGSPAPIDAEPAPAEPANR